MSYKSDHKSRETSFVHGFLVDMAKMIDQIAGAMLMGFGFIAGVMLFFVLSEMIAVRLHKPTSLPIHIEIRADK